MNNLGNMPTAGLVVMIIIGLLFILAVLLLFHVYLRYKLLAGKAKGDPEKVRGFRAAVLAEYTNAYQKYGQDTNTPAIITDTVAAKLSGLLFCERFLNNAVSLFVTLGLFGTFLGLSRCATPAGRTGSPSWTAWAAACSPPCRAWAWPSTPPWWARAARFCSRS